MEIIKITQERMEQVLPKNVKNSDLSVNAKKILASIINYHLVNEKVRVTGFLAISNDNLRQSACIGKDYLMTAIQELIECRLIDRKAGKKWKRGEPKMATEYRLIKENLLKPIQKPTNEQLLEILFNAPETTSVGNSPTNTNTYTDSESDTKSDSESSTINITKIGSLAPLGGGAAPVKIDRVKKTEEELENEFRQHRERIIQELDSQLQGVTQYHDISNINNQVLSSMSNLCLEPYYTRLQKVVGIRLEQFKKELLVSMTSST